MTRDDTVTLLKELNSANIYAHTFNYECIISNKDTKELQKYNTIATENVTFVNEWNDLNAKTYPKIIAIDYSNTNKLQIFQDDFIRQGHTKQFDTFFSSQYFLEFCKKDSNKGNGMNALANYLNIPLRDTIAIGDERNDIPMIELAGIGCAMANAHKETKISADYVTENNNNYSGVAEVIEKYIL